jgi:acyl carrier protein
LREELVREAEAGVEPEELYELGKELGYEVEISWLGHGKEGCYNAAFWQGGGKHAVFGGGDAKLRGCREYGNDPVKEKRIRQVVPQLKDYLKEKLPEYMVPSMIMVLEKMPLMANGKVDRKALPKPDRTRMEVAGGYVEARNETEAKLVRIWCDVLGLDRVGINDNFFELGGHSLLATQVISRVRSMFREELPLRTLFEAPTVAGFAAIIVRYCEAREKVEQMELLKKIESQTEEETEAELNKSPMGGQNK